MFNSGRYCLGLLIIAFVLTSVCFAVGGGTTTVQSCNASSNPCMLTATCSVTAGNTLCLCPQGYTGSGRQPDGCSAVTTEYSINLLVIILLCAGGFGLTCACIFIAVQYLKRAERRDANHREQQLQRSDTSDTEMLGSKQATQDSLMNQSAYDTCYTANTIVSKPYSLSNSTRVPSHRLPPEARPRTSSLRTQLPHPAPKGVFFPPRTTSLREGHLNSSFSFHGSSETCLSPKDVGRSAIYLNKESKSVRSLCNDPVYITDADGSKKTRSLGQYKGSDPGYEDFRPKRRDPRQGVPHKTDSFTSNRSLQNSAPNVSNNDGYMQLYTLQRINKAGSCSGLSSAGLSKKTMSTSSACETEA